MKMKKYLFMILAATLFAACGGDGDDDVNNGSKPGMSSVNGFTDYSSLIGKDYSRMVEVLGEPHNQSESEKNIDYYYNYHDDNTVKFVIRIEKEKQFITKIDQQVSIDACKIEDVVNYFGSRYVRNDNGTGRRSYAFSDSGDPEKATLLIYINDNSDKKFYDFEIDYRYFNYYEELAKAGQL